jgi:RNA 3'-phosphate cyclase
MIQVDGSHGEGGGQIVRTATSFAALTGKPCHIFNIRAGRQRPGLMRQHLCGIRALRELTGGKLDGDEIGSREITFAPSSIRADNLYVAIETAGSITLVVQSLLPAALFAPSPLKIVFGGGATCQDGCCE